MSRVVSEIVAEPGQVELAHRPRTTVVSERGLGGGRFELAEGPFRSYHRAVSSEVRPDGTATIRQTVDFELAVPYWGWLFVWPMRRELGRIGERRAPFWAPPERLDSHAAAALGVLCAVAVLAGYLGTLMTQTVAFAAETFDTSETGQGVALASVRLGALVALALAALADRAGRRRVTVACALAGPLFAALGAAAPSMEWLTGSQVVARSFAVALGVIVAVVAAEEMPAGARAYGVSLLSMAGALGVGLCVMLLFLADAVDEGWRLIYLLALVGVPLALSLRRTLPESRRFEASHPQVGLSGHGRRLWLLAVGAFLVAVFAAPVSQFQNQFLREERELSAVMISLFVVSTNVPGGIGIIVGGRLAERGRRPVAAIGLAGGALATVAMFTAAGWPLWAWSVVGSVVGSITVPALGVYGPEMFPTSLRGRLNGVLAIVGLAGSAIGLVVTGVLADVTGTLAWPIALLATGPIALAFVVVRWYPETARLELEVLNPEDAPRAPGPPGSS